MFDEWNQQFMFLFTDFNANYNGIANSSKLLRLDTLSVGVNIHTFAVFNAENWLIQRVSWVLQMNSSFDETAIRSTNSSIQYES